jgi:glucan phosphoethanolaminetransferase (alkaline phosphatase superfamily)
MTARDHNKLLSIFYFIMAGLQLFAAIFVFIMYVGIGGVLMSSSTREDEQMMGGFFMGMGVIVAVIVLAIGAFTLFTAFKVLREQPIGRTLGIIISILVLLSFPLGTALGIYGLWFFFGDVGKNFYAGLSPGSSVPPPPPSPNSWQ